MLDTWYTKEDRYYVFDFYKEDVMFAADNILQTYEFPEADCFNAEVVTYGNPEEMPVVKLFFRVSSKDAADATVRAYLAQKAPTETVLSVDYEDGVLVITTTVWTGIAC